MCKCECENIRAAMAAIEKNARRIGLNEASMVCLRQAIAFRENADDKRAAVAAELAGLIDDLKQQEG